MVGRIEHFLSPMFLGPLLPLQSPRVYLSSGTSEVLHVTVTAPPARHSTPRPVVVPRAAPLARSLPQHPHTREARITSKLRRLQDTTSRAQAIAKPDPPKMMLRSPAAKSSSRQPVPMLPTFSSSALLLTLSLLLAGTWLPSSSSLGVNAEAIEMSAVYLELQILAAGGSYMNAHGDFASRHFLSSTSAVVRCVPV